MSGDMCSVIDDGIINIRVGAIILKEDQVLMVAGARDDFYYSVGGRIKFGETAEQAVLREVYEETGVLMETDRLGFISENYFRGTTGDNAGSLVYELCFFYYMKTPADFEPLCKSFTENGEEERLVWVSLNTKKKVYPLFLMAELTHPVKEIKHIVTDER